MNFLDLMLAVRQVFNFTGFIAGLVFFMMGFVILLQFQQYKHLSDLKIVKKIWILALFGITQGLAQWAGALMPITLAPHVPGYLGFWLGLWELLLNTASYCFLYWFAVEVMVLVLNRDYYLRLTVGFLFLLWLLIFLLTYSPNWVNWLSISLAWSRFILALPGSILAALALSLQVKEFSSIGIPNLVANLYGAIISFCIYSLACGLNAPKTPLFTLFTGSWYITLADILRIGSGLGIAGFTIIIMEIFNIETKKKLVNIQHREVILQERLRIGRDLHDGVIQSLYAIGLSLEVANNSVDTSIAKTKDILNSALINLDDTIKDIRYYILDLTLPENSSLKWTESLASLVESFAPSGLNIQTSLEVGDDVFNHRLDKSQELLYIIREALSNVVRHAQAQKVTLHIYQEGEQLHLRIADDGRGFNPGEELNNDSLSGHGLKNIKERAAKLGGEFHIHGQLPGGTLIHVSVPLKELIPRGRG